MIPDLERKLKAIEHSKDAALSGEAVTAEHIAGVVSRWTGIPMEKMLEGQREKLLHMETDLAGRVVGQDEAVRAISNAVRRARAGLQDPPELPKAAALFSAAKWVNTFLADLVYAAGI